MAEKRQKKQAVKAFEKETFSKDKEVTGVKHIEHRQDNTFSVENQFSAREKPVSNLPQDANHGSRTRNATSGHNVQKWKGRKNEWKKWKEVIDCGCSRGSCRKGSEGCHKGKKAGGRTQVCFG